ncbi:MAG: diaminopimelate epimerase, partial [Halobacteriaceae archaeon]
MAVIAFEKWHGAGNDFVIVEADAPIEDRRGFAVRECDRERGVGADGVLFLDLRPGEPVRVEMALYQPDGSTAAMCGNGARCAA